MLLISRGNVFTLMEVFSCLKKHMKKHGDINTVAVILAGGRGERAGGKYKQFEEIAGKPLIFFSLEKFIRCNFITEIIVVVPQEKFSYASKIINEKFGKKKIKLIFGGKTRKESSFYALKYLKNKRKKVDYVVFHDAARPLVSRNMIREVWINGIKYNASVLGIKAIDTVSLVNNDLMVISSPPKTFYTFTPHCYKFDLIWRAHLASKGVKSLKSAENMLLVLGLGKKVKMIDKCYPNIKVTFKADVEIIQALLSNR